MSRKLAKLLELKPEEIKAAKALREKSIEDAVVLKKGPSREQMQYHVLWSGHGYEVGAGKPGKETTRTIPNPHDMWPFIRKNGKFEDKSATFKDIFHELEKMSRKSVHSLELLGCLLARSAVMLDHQVIDGRVIYTPPMQVVEEISKEIPTMFNVPLSVFLQYLDTIALNEDVKYQRNLNSKGKKYNRSAGRPNNLLTCVHLIAVLLERASIVDFGYGFAQQRGVSALKKNIDGIFPLLKLESQILEEVI